MQALNAALFVAAECCFTTALRRSSRVSFLKHECVCAYIWIYNDMNYQLDNQSLERLRVFKILPTEILLLFESSHHFSMESLKPLLRNAAFWFDFLSFCSYSLDRAWHAVHKNMPIYKALIFYWNGSRICTGSRFVLCSYFLARLSIKLLVLDS